MAGARLLVASRDHALRRLFELVARQRPFDVAFVDAIDQLEGGLSAHAPDLLVLDLDDGRDGMETLREIAAHADAPRLLLTGGDDPRVLDAARQVGRARGLEIGPPLHKGADEQHVLRALLDGLRLDDRPITGDDIERALRNDEFELYYMPLKLVRTGSIQSAEALLRWRHPEYGTPVDPLRVVAVAESHGLSRDLTRWVMRTALARARAWETDGWDFKMAVNVVASELLDPTFVDDVKAIVDEAGVEPTRLVIELTESHELTERIEVLEAVASLRMIGVELGIDDFGKGYSSLDRLRRVPFTELKIDKDFVLNAFDNPQTQVITRAMVELGHSLGMSVVAEGVSSRKAWELVDELGCDLAQGFFVGEPLPAADFDDWLYRWGLPPAFQPDAAHGFGGANGKGHGRHPAANGHGSAATGDGEDRDADRAPAGAPVGDGAPTDHDADRPRTPNQGPIELYDPS